MNGTSHVLPPPERLDPETIALMVFWALNLLVVMALYAFWTVAWLIGERKQWRTWTIEWMFALFTVLFFSFGCWSGVLKLLGNDLWFNRFLSGWVVLTLVLLVGFAFWFSREVKRGSQEPQAAELSG